MNPRERRPGPCARALPSILLLCLAVGATAAEDAFLAAVARAPGVLAAHLRVEAAQRGARAAGVLPDPMLAVDLGRKRQGMGDDMTMYGAMLSQGLPRWGEREAMRLQAAAQVDLAEADLAEALGEHAATVALAAAEAAAATATRAQLSETATRVQAMRELVRARLAAAGAMIGESLSLETRAQNLAVQIAEQERRISDAEAEARGRLGLPATQPIPAVTYPDPAAVDPERVPMARRARAMHRDAQAMQRQALARAHPETALELRWEREGAGTAEQSDAYSLALSVSLPVWRQAYADAADGAHANARAATHEAAATGWMARSQVARAQRAAAFASQARTAAEAVAVRTGSEYEAVIRQVGTGAASVAAALDLLDRISEARMQAIEAELASRTALAGLWRLAPPDPALGTDVPPVPSDPEHGRDARATSGKAPP